MLFHHCSVSSEDCLNMNLNDSNKFYNTLWIPRVKLFFIWFRQLNSRLFKHWSFSCWISGFRSVIFHFITDLSSKPWTHRPQSWRPPVLRAGFAWKAAWLPHQLSFYTLPRTARPLHRIIRGSDFQDRLWKIRISRRSHETQPSK